MKDPAAKKTSTRPGLGQANGLPRVDSAEMKRVRASFRHDPGPESSKVLSDSTVPRRLRDSVRREEDDEPTSQQASKPPQPPTSVVPPRSDRPTSSWREESTTATRQRRSNRAPVAVDDVGVAAVKIARTTRRDSAPKLVATRGMIAKAPLDTRAAFVLSLVDGRNTIESIVDMAGMPAAEVQQILDRLARLGIIALP